MTTANSISWARFDTIQTHQLPLIHPHCCLALRMIFSHVEEGAHKLRFQFVDEDGRPLMQMQNNDLPFEVARA